ncbi:MAG: pyridoxamine kinase [Clostridia bacterium]|nr:pyridoxamine kinase [Clostridia bacterium]
MERINRVLAIHDISGFGKCSLTVALPVISACGIETTVMPTAVLSTHTGGFTGYTWRDLTSDMQPMADHWKSINIGFDAIYSGYLGSFEQIEIVKSIVKDFKEENSFFLCDPAMADHGKMYALFDMNFAKKMAELCSLADIIVPNFTEAAFMTGEEYKEGPYTKEYVEDMLVKLAALGPKKIVLTGVYFDSDNLGCACYDNGNIEYIMMPRLEGVYHGTGDVFASSLCGALMCRKSLKKATEIAAKFTCGCIERTLKYTPDVRYGVAFEGELPKLIKELGLYE